MSQFPNLNKVVEKVHIKLNPSIMGLLYNMAEDAGVTPTQMLQDLFSHILMPEHTPPRSAEPIMSAYLESTKTTGR